MSAKPTLTKEALFAIWIAKPEYFGDVAWLEANPDWCDFLEANPSCYEEFESKLLSDVQSHGSEIARDLNGFNLNSNSNRPTRDNNTSAGRPDEASLSSADYMKDVEEQQEATIRVEEPNANINTATANNGPVRSSTTTTTYRSPSDLLNGFGTTTITTNRIMPTTSSNSNDNAVSVVSFYKLPIPTASKRKRQADFTPPDEPSAEGLLAIKKLRHTQGLEIEHQRKSIEVALNKIWLTNTKIEQTNFMIDAYAHVLNRYQERVKMNKLKKLAVKERRALDKVDDAQESLNAIKSIKSYHHGTVDAGETNGSGLDAENDNVGDAEGQETY